MVIEKSKLLVKYLCITYYFKKYVSTNDIIWQDIEQNILVRSEKNKKEIFVS